MRAPNPTRYKRIPCKPACVVSRLREDVGDRLQVDRRHLLLGLGGLYGTSARKALGDPIVTTPPITCTPSKIPDLNLNLNCCPPKRIGEKAIDFKHPPAPTELRVRQAAHLVDAAYLEKYETAVSRMQSLPPDDPRNFCQQANVHCAYCDAAYHQEHHPDKEIQVHGSWLFFPWHRIYLYFHERILAKLLDDDESFALPFWNWDAPDGMTLPAIYANQSSPLYCRKRDPEHRPCTLVDLNFGNDGDTGEGDVPSNLALMYRQMISNAPAPVSFFGQPLRSGEVPEPDDAGGGSIEHTPHNTVHDWTGDPRQPNHENMGVLYAAARDPIFYAHHGNVDRMWDVWKSLDEKNKDISDSDYGDASFYFYDENAQLVRVRIRDCLDSARMGYTYQHLDLPWLKTPPQPLARPAKARVPKAEVPAEPTFPLVLGSPVTVTVKRPRPGRSEEEKAREVEVLVVRGIELDPGKRVKFDVYVEAEDDYKELGPTAVEMAGSFVNIPHAHHGNLGGKAAMRNSSKLTLGLTDLLRLREAEAQESLRVTFVPRVGMGDVIIGGVAVEYLSITP